MAAGDSDDIQKLLREVDESLGESSSATAVLGSTTRPVARRSEHTWRGALAVATSSAVVAAGVVFIVFSMLPILGALSGAAGAFIAAYVTVLVGRLARRF